MDKRTKAYLAKKQLGGEINQRGNDYELTFACYRILQLILRYPTHLHQVSFSSQYPGFVDDLFISVNVPGYDKDLFHQLKTSKRLYWGNGPGSLHYDFYQQGKEQYKNRKAYNLFLVVSDDGVHRHMKRSMPTKLRKHSSVEPFPWLGSLNAHCIHHLRFKQLAEQLCAFTDTDKVNALVKCILACWAATNKKDIRLSQIINDVRKIGYSYLRSSVPLILRDEVARILMAIPGFQFEVVHGYLSWTFSATDRGQIQYPIDSTEFRNIEDEIIAKQPATFDDLEPVIS